MSTERELIQMRRRRARILKFVRQGHEKQFSRMDDFDVYAMMQDAGWQMGRKQVITMVQDLCTLGYVKYVQGFDEDEDRVTLSEIELTPLGLNITVRQLSNDEVLFS